MAGGARQIQTGGAVRALMGLQARTPRRGAAARAPTSTFRSRPVRLGDCCGSGRAKRSRSTACSSRASRVDEPCSRASRCPSTGAGRPGHRCDAETAGSFVMRATRVGRDTTLAQIVRWSRTRRDRRRPSSDWPTASREVFVPASWSLQALTFAGWSCSGRSPGHARDAAAIAVLIIACPCASAWRRRPRSWSAPAGRRVRHTHPRRRGARARRRGRHGRARQDRHPDPGGPRSSAVVAPEGQSERGARLAAASRRAPSTRWRRDLGAPRTPTRIADVRALRAVAGQGVSGASRSRRERAARQAAPSWPSTASEWTRPWSTRRAATAARRGTAVFVARDGRRRA